MKPEFKKTFFISLLIAAVLSLLSFSNGYNNSTFIIMGLIFLAIGSLYFFGGFIALLIPATREVGKALVLSAGILLLIGISVCTGWPLKINI